MAKNEECDFDAINLRSNERTPCTLDFGMDFDSVGIRINMPAQAKVSFDAETGRLSHDSRVPVCLAMQFPQREVLGIDLMQDHISVVMINTATGESITNNLVSSRSRVPVPQREMSDEEIATSVRGFYVNANLVEYLPIPAVKAKYKVYALFKTHKSNVVTIELK